MIRVDSGASLGCLVSSTIWALRAWTCASRQAVCRVVKSAMSDRNLDRVWQQGKRDGTRSGGSSRKRGLCPVQYRLSSAVKVRGLGLGLVGVGTWSWALGWGSHPSKSERLWFHLHICQELALWPLLPPPLKPISRSTQQRHVDCGKPRESLRHRVLQDTPRIQVPSSLEVAPQVGQQL